MITESNGLVCLSHKKPLFRIDLKFTCIEGCAFEVIKGIPRFTNSQYAEAFGFQWNRFRKTQLDSFTGSAITRNRLIEACGMEVWNFLGTAKVLEVGCGAGRFTEVLLDTGAIVNSVDLSLAVEANVQNFPVSNKHTVLQADLARLPFNDRSFDVVFCLGVIQHTPNPEETILHLSNQVKEGGWLVIDHYDKSISWYFRTACLVRLVLKRLQPAVALSLIEGTYRITKPLFRISKNRIYRKVLNILIPVVYFENELPDLKAEMRDEWSILDTFDGLTDWHKHRRGPEQIMKTLLSAGLTNIVCFRGGNGIVARGQKPVSSNPNSLVEL